MVLVAFTGFLRLGSTVGHVVVSGTVAVLLALLLCTVFELDHSYATDQRITSGPFQHALTFSTPSTTTAATSRAERWRCVTALRRRYG